MHHAQEHCHDEETYCSTKVQGTFYKQHHVGLLARLSNKIGSLFASI